jgi:hypothetical protein
VPHAGGDVEQVGSVPISDRAWESASSIRHPVIATVASNGSRAAAFRGLEQRTNVGVGQHPARLALHLGRDPG